MNLTSLHDGDSLQGVGTGLRVGTAAGGRGVGSTAKSTPSNQIQSNRNKGVSHLGAVRTSHK